MRNVVGLKRAPASQDAEWLGLRLNFEEVRKVGGLGQGFLKLEGLSKNMSVCVSVRLVGCIS